MDLLHVIIPVAEESIYEVWFAVSCDIPECVELQLSNLQNQ